jgi:predicted AlkP superfamily pyrophosphatase or phosphodiesterase
VNRNRQFVSARLVVLCLDGLRPDLYRRAGELGLKVPNLTRLVAEGASADAVESVFPSTTYPAHATLVTGVAPRVHGIYSHLASLDPFEPARPWHWHAQAIHVPALWSATRAAGLRTAAVTWPVSAGAPIDHNIPEIWDAGTSDLARHLEVIGRHSTPGLFSELMAELKRTASHLFNEPERARDPATLDGLRAEAARYLWRKYRPDLLMVHLVSFDQAAHRTGPLSPESLAAVERLDAEIGRIREATNGKEPVRFVVLSDHGFVPVDREAAPLVALCEEGLFPTTRPGHTALGKLGAIHAGGSFAVYWLEEPDAAERRALERAVLKLEQSGAVAEVVGRDRLETLQADPDAEFILDAAPGYYFSDRRDGPLVRPSEKDHGTHGHLPTRPGLEAAFLVAGPGVSPGKKLGRIRLTQVARVLAASLALSADLLMGRDDLLDLS